MYNDDDLLASNKRKPMFQQPEWKYITPEYAASLVSVQNRKIKPSVVKEYTRLMNAGLWRISPHGICIGQDAKCSDGNHRMTALAASSISGLWFLVCNWMVKANDLRVDRGSNRSLSDFASINQNDGTVLCALGSFLGVGNGNRKDPTEMQPVVNAFLPLVEKLHASCNTMRRGRSMASVRAAAVISMCAQEQRADEIAYQYREMVLNGPNQMPATRLLGNALDTQNMDQMEVIAKTYTAFTEPQRGKLYATRDCIADARLIARAWCHLCSAKSTK